jgi:hypothetical protein
MRSARLLVGPKGLTRAPRVAVADLARPDVLLVLAAIHRFVTTRGRPAKRSELVRNGLRPVAIDGLTTAGVLTETAVGSIRSYRVAPGIIDKLKDSLG